MKQFNIIKKIAVLLSVFFIYTNAAALDISRTMGDKDAPVVIEEFSSITCSHCAKLHNTIMPDLKKLYVDTGKVRIVYRNYPLDNVAMAGSMLALTIPKDRYFKFINYMFFYQKELHATPLPTLQKWAEMAGVDRKTLNEILQDKKLMDAIKQDMRKIESKYAIKGTPLVVINGKEFINWVDKKAIFAFIDKQIKN